jgi:hypothetical protein
LNRNRDRIHETIGELSQVLGLAHNLEATHLAGLLAHQERSLLEGVLRLSRVHAELLAMQLDSLAVELVEMEADEEASSDTSEPVGLSATEIEGLPWEECGPDARGVGATCVVCQEGFGEGQHVRILPSCSHCYHKGCIDRWLALKPRCPLCNHVFKVDHWPGSVTPLTLGSLPPAGP